MDYNAGIQTHLRFKFDNGAKHIYIYVHSGGVWRVDLTKEWSDQNAEVDVLDKEMDRRMETFYLSEFFFFHLIWPLVIFFSSNNIC